jgi:hypothetical protein
MTEHRGRVVKNTGDRMLADFSSVVDAVRCAVDVQRRRAAKVTRGGAAALVGVDLGECPYDYEESWGRYPSHIVTSRFGGSECGCHLPQYRARVEAFLPGTVSTVVRIEYRASAGRAPNTPIPNIHSIADLTAGV